VQWTGLALAAAAQALEAVADRQLAAHRRDPDARGRACRRGLWRFSRHPNYFAEWLTWCGIGLTAAPAAGAWALLQPVVMFVLVRFVTGVPYAERQSLKSRGEDFVRYQQETNAFFPWLPRQTPSR
jgi:steroid 5-alpha reductase family enzyme